MALDVRLAFEPEDLPLKEPDQQLLRFDFVYNIKSLKNRNSTIECKNEMGCHGCIKVYMVIILIFLHVVVLLISQTRMAWRFKMDSFSLEFALRMSQKISKSGDSLCI